MHNSQIKLQHTLTYNCFFATEFHFADERLEQVELQFCDHIIVAVHPIGVRLVWYM